MRVGKVASGSLFLYIAVILAFEYSGNVSAESVIGENKYIFYKGPRDGSELQFGTLNVFLNLGLGFMAVDRVSPQLYELNFSRNLSMMKSSSTVSSIESEYGSFGRYLFSEFVPLLGRSSPPNYALHLIGEGMLSRKLREYYLYNGYSEAASWSMAVAVITSAQIMNEIVEAPFVKAGDAAADFVFNAAGIIAFSFDGFARLFFNDYLKLYYWPGQPVIDTRDMVIFNQAEEYLLRITMGKWTDTKIGLLLGLPTMGFGLSFPDKIQYIQKSTISAFLVFHSEVIPPYPYENNSQNGISDIKNEKKGVIGLRFALDRYDSLLAYMEIAKGQNISYTLNLYPAFLKIGSLAALGVFCYLQQDYVSAFALTVSNLSVVPGYRW